MQVKLKKKPVRVGERAEVARVKVHYNGIKQGFQHKRSFIGYINCFDKETCESDNSYSYEDIRSYIAKHFEEYIKIHPLELGKSADSEAIIDAEKKRYANFIWEFMNFVVNQD